MMRFKQALWSNSAAYQALGNEDGVIDEPKSRATNGMSKPQPFIALTMLVLVLSASLLGYFVGTKVKGAREDDWLGKLTFE